MSKGSRQLVLGVTLFLFVLTFGYVFQQFRSLEAPGADRVPYSETILSEGAELVIHFLLSDGQVAKTEIISASADLIGKGILDVQSMMPRWKIVSFSSDRLVVNEFCGESELQGGFLRDTGGYVGIYSGDIDGCHRLVEQTAIPVDDLSDWARTSLKNGIEFRDQNDLPQLLDGLRGAG